MRVHACMQALLLGAQVRGGRGVAAAGAGVGARACVCGCGCGCRCVHLCVLCLSLCLFERSMWSVCVFARTRACRSMCNVCGRPLQRCPCLRFGSARLEPLCWTSQSRSPHARVSFGTCALAPLEQYALMSDV